MGRPLDEILYGDDVLPLRFRTNGSQRIDTIEICPLVGVALGCLSLLGWMRDMMRVMVGSLAKWRWHMQDTVCYKVV